MKVCPIDVLGDSVTIPLIATVEVARDLEEELIMCWHTF